MSTQSYPDPETGAPPFPFLRQEGVPTSLFEKELEHVINRYSIENESNTPDFILAQYIRGCLSAFAMATQQRETWHGRDPRPGAPIVGGENPSDA